MTASEDTTARVWDVPTVTSKDSAEDVALLAELAEASSGFVVQTSGQAEILNLLTARQVRETLKKIAVRLAGSSGLTPLQRCLKWSVSERGSRTIFPSPISPLLSGLTIGLKMEHSAVCDALFCRPGERPPSGAFLTSLLPITLLKKERIRTKPGGLGEKLIFKRGAH